MKRVFELRIAAAAGIAAFGIAFSGCVVERYSLSADAEKAAAVLRAIDSAEQGCRERSGHYVLPAEAEENRCDGVRSATLQAKQEGYLVEIMTQPYSLRVVPEAREKLVSMYIDQTAQIHIGTKERLASPKTAVYHDRL